MSNPYFYPVTLEKNPTETNLTDYFEYKGFSLQNFNELIKSNKLNRLSSEIKGKLYSAYLDGVKQRESNTMCYPARLSIEVIYKDNLPYYKKKEY